MKIYIFLLATLLVSASAAPGSFSQQQYQFHRSSASYRNDELQHKDDEMGRYARVEDSEKFSTPQEETQYRRSQYHAPDTDEQAKDDNDDYMPVGYLGGVKGSLPSAQLTGFNSASSRQSFASSYGSSTGYGRTGSSVHTNNERSDNGYSNNGQHMMMMHHPHHFNHHPHRHFTDQSTSNSNSNYFRQGHSHGFHHQHGIPSYSQNSDSTFAPIASTFTNQNTEDDKLVNVGHTHGIHYQHRIPSYSQNSGSTFAPVTTTLTYQNKEDDTLVNLDNMQFDYSKFKAHGFGKEYLEDTEGQNVNIVRTTPKFTITSPKENIRPVYEDNSESSLTKLSSASQTITQSYSNQGSTQRNNQNSQQGQHTIFNQGSLVHNNNNNQDQEEDDKQMKEESNYRPQFQVGPTWNHEQKQEDTIHHHTTGYVKPKPPGYGYHTYGGIVHNHGSYDEVDCTQEHSHQGKIESMDHHIHNHETKPTTERIKENTTKFSVQEKVTEQSQDQFSGKEMNQSSVDQNAEEDMIDGKSSINADRETTTDYRYINQQNAHRGTMEFESGNHHRHTYEEQQSGNQNWHSEDHGTDLTQKTQNEYGQFEFGSQHNQQSENSQTQIRDDKKYKESEINGHNYQQNTNKQWHIDEKDEITQQTQDVLGQFEFGSQTNQQQQNTDKYQSQNNDKNSKSDEHEDLTQQTQNEFGQLEFESQNRPHNVNQQVQTNYNQYSDEYQQNSDKHWSIDEHDDLTQQTQDGFGKFEFGSQTNNQQTQSREDVQRYNRQNNNKYQQNNNQNGKLDQHEDSAQQVQSQSSRQQQRINQQSQTREHKNYHEQQQFESGEHQQSSNKNWKIDESKDLTQQTQEGFRGLQFSSQKNQESTEQSSDGWSQLEFGNNRGNNEDLSQQTQKIEGFDTNLHQGRTNSYGRYGNSASQGYGASRSYSYSSSNSNQYQYRQHSISSGADGVTDDLKPTSINYESTQNLTQNKEQFASEVQDVSQQVQQEKELHLEAQHETSFEPEEEVAVITQVTEKPGFWKRLGSSIKEKSKSIADKITNIG